MSVQTEAEVAIEFTNVTGSTEYTNTQHTPHTTAGEREREREREGERERERESRSRGSSFSMIGSGYLPHMINKQHSLYMY